MRVLVLNCGSTSVRFRVTVDGLDVDGGRIPCNGARAHALAVAQVLAGQEDPPDAVGHRVTHGGPGLARPARVDAAVIDALRAARGHAPLHLPVQIEAMLAACDALPGVPQIACFDTGFHATMPEVARRLPIPGRYDARGIRRYGFHGLAVESVVRALGAGCPPRLVVAHLGGGCSVTAVRDGRSVDTTMAFTPEGGVMMPTRPGDLDPGVVLEIARAEPDRADEVLARECGLAAVSGGTDDVRVLLAERHADARAALALDMFTASVRGAIAAMAATLGGIDCLAFSGGIGENAPAIRADACAGLGFMGVHLDPAANAAGVGAVGREGAPVDVRVVPADEEAVIAWHVVALLAATEAADATAGAAAGGSGGRADNMPPT